MWNNFNLNLQFGNRRIEGNVKDSVMKAVTAKGKLSFCNADTSKCHIKLDLKQAIQYIIKLANSLPQDI